MDTDYISEEWRDRVARFAARIRGGVRLGLKGGLGAGKTVFAGALIKAYYRLNGLEAPKTPSPTYAMVEVYSEVTPAIWHFDFYRLQHPSELRELGWERASREFIIAEWPEKLGKLWGDAPVLDVEAMFGGDMSQADHIARPWEICRA